MKKLIAIFFIFIHCSLVSNVSDSLFVPKKMVFSSRILAPVFNIATFKIKNSKILTFSAEYIYSKRITFNSSLNLININSRIFSSTTGFSTTADAYSNEINFVGDFKWYLNKKKFYPRGFFLGVSLLGGFAVGEVQQTFQYEGIIYNGQIPYKEPVNSKFTVFIFGLAPVVGYQYFLDKKKRVVMGHRLGVYFKKNIMNSESTIISDYYRLYKINENTWAPDFWWYFGFTLGNRYNKTDYR